MWTTIIGRPGAWRRYGILSTDRQQDPSRVTRPCLRRTRTTDKSIIQISQHVPDVLTAGSNAGGAPDRALEGVDHSSLVN